VSNIPAGVQNCFVLTFNEFDVVLLALRTVVLGYLHQPKGRVFISVPRLNKEDFLASHDRILMSFQDFINSIPDLEAQTAAIMRRKYSMQNDKWARTRVEKSRILEAIPSAVMAGA